MSNANQSPAEGDEAVLIPLTLLEDASSAIGNFVSDHGWSDEDMQVMDNLDAFIAQHKANAAAHVQPKGTAEPIGYLSEHNVPQENPYRWQFSKTLAGVYRDTALRIIPVYEPAAQAPAPAPDADPLFLLHCGQIDSSGEQDDWDIEADSGKRVEEFCRLHPGQTVNLYPHVQYPAVGDRPEAAGLAEARDEGWRAALESAARICDATPPSPFRPSIEAAHAIRQLLGPKPRCTLCGYQHGHAIGCERNPVDLALQAASQPPVQNNEGEKL